MRLNHILCCLVLMSLGCKKEQLALLPLKPKLAVMSSDTIPDGGWLKLYIKHDTLTVDETVIKFQHAVTPYYSPQTDAIYFQGMGIASLSSLTADNIPCAIQTRLYQSDLSLKLRVEIRQNGDYNIGMSSLIGIPSGIKIILVDSLRHDTTDLRANIYSFSTAPISNGTPDSKRFKLLLR